MPFKLFSEIALSLDYPEYQLQQGDIATLIDFVSHPDGGEIGCTLEIFNAVGDSIKIVTIPISAIKPLTSNDVLSIRPLIPA